MAQRRLVRAAAARAAQPRLVVRLRAGSDRGWPAVPHAVRDRRVHAALPGHRGGTTTAVRRCAAVPDRPVRRTWATGARPVGQWPRVRRQGSPSLARQGWREDAVHRAGQPLGERLLRELQLKAPRRAAQWRDLHDASRGPGADRELATALQCRQAALVARKPAAGAGSHLAASPWPALRSAPVSTRAGQTGRTVTHGLVSLQGADQPALRIVL